MNGNVIQLGGRGQVPLRCSSGLLAVALGVAILAGCGPTGPVMQQLPPPVVPDQSHTAIEPSPQPPVVTPRRSQANIRGVVIVVDAGHGGKDPGAQGRSRLPEKTIVLDIANKLASTLASAGAQVITTRNADFFVELDDRCNIAERRTADLFISIHADSSRKPDVSGATIYISRSASSESQQAAIAVEAALRREGLESRGINRAGFRVLTGHSRPAILIETGFLTNLSDVRRLNNDAQRTRIANAIAAGVIDYFSR